MSTAVKNAGYLLELAAAAANVRAYGEGVAVPGNPWFRYHQCDAWELAKGLHESGLLEPTWPPVPNWATWNGTDNVAAFLNAIDDYPTWYTTSGDDQVGGYARRPASALSASPEFFECVVADWMLPLVSGQAFGANLARRSSAPVWPGTDKVTLSGWLPFYNGYEIAQPMDGLIVQMLEIPPAIGHYAFHNVNSYVKAGMVAFADDRGDYEWPVGFSFETHVVMPKTMARAYRAIIRCHSAITGQVNPFTIDGSNIPAPP